MTGMTNHPLHQANSVIRKEADDILYGRGLFDILKESGTPYITGSYDLGLMTWRDLDVYLETDGISQKDFFELGSRIATGFSPVKMSFRNELPGKTKGLPEGLYWGVYLGNERAGAWKIDVWAVKPPECRRLLDYCENIKKKLAPETALTILDIKSRCWQDPEYRRSYGSSDIYRAVLEKNITGIEEFRHYLQSITT